MPGQKLIGSTHITVCPSCKDELVTGLVRSETKPIGSDQLKLKTATGRIPELAEGPLTCSDGNVTVRFDPLLGITFVVWRDQEPTVGTSTYNDISDRSVIVKGEKQNAK